MDGTFQAAEGEITLSCTHGEITVFHFDLNPAVRAVPLLVARVVAQGVLLPKLGRHLLAGLVNLVYTLFEVRSLQQERFPARYICKSQKRIHTHRILENTFPVPEAAALAVPDPEAINEDFCPLSKSNSLL